MARHVERIAIHTAAQPSIDADLGGLANRVAHAILGVGGRVAVLFEREVAGIAAFLAVLERRAGRGGAGYRVVVAGAGVPAGSAAAAGAAPGRNAMNTVPSAEIPAISIRSVVNPAAFTVGPST
jgi:hypothetical protein